MDIDVGKIEHIRIWHDNSGAGPGWFLDSVLIRKKYSRSRVIADTFVERLEQLGHVYRHRAQDQIKKAMAKSSAKDDQSHASDRLNPKSKYYDEDERNQRLGSSQSILRSPAGRDKASAQKSVRWDQQSVDSSNNVSLDRAQRMSPPQKRPKDEPLTVESGHFDHHVYWISSHIYADNKWQIKSVEEKDKVLLDSSTRSSLLVDRAAANNKAKVSADEKDDDVYEFEANRWLAKDEGDKKIEVVLKPKSTRLSSATTNEVKPKTSDVKKKPPVPSSMENFPNARFDRSDELQGKRMSPLDLGRSDRSPKGLERLDRSPREMTHSSPHISGRPKHLEELAMDRYSKSASSPHLKQSPSRPMVHESEFPPTNPDERPHLSRTVAASFVDRPHAQSPRTRVEFASPLTSHRETSNKMSSEQSLRPKSALRSTAMDSPSQRAKLSQFALLSHLSLVHFWCLLGQIYTSAYGVMPTDDF